MMRSHSNNAIFAIAIALALSSMVPAAWAQESAYLAMRPDSEFCRSITFGLQGRGEYRLYVDDPGYPNSPWIDSHLASFVTGPGNPVIIPLCINTDGRRLGDSAVIDFTLETPERNMTFFYGICVSNHEDIDEVSFSSEDPCEITTSHTDVFSIDLIQSEKYALPGETVPFSLLISSGFPMVISLDKKSGPEMERNKTAIDMPGEKIIGMAITAPAQTGEYPFTITATAGNCYRPSCTKEVSGILHVTGSGELEGYQADFSPRNKDVTSTGPTTFYLSVTNFELPQYFTVSVETDSMLSYTIESEGARIGTDRTKVFDITVTPLSYEHVLHTITVTVENEENLKKAVQSTLTIDEALSDAWRAAENNSELDSDVSDFEDDYKNGANLDDWQDVNELLDDFENPDIPTDALPINWILIVAICAAIGIAAVYIYRNVKVENEMDSGYMQPSG